ncbi:MAG: hypothetical protein AAGL89_00215 [Pseudomonadota bacterium]
MDEPLFDTIFALVSVAEAEGFEAVAEGLEMVLDVYLKERETVLGIGLKFVSRRAAQARDIDAFEAEAKEPSLACSWSSYEFPLLRIR